MTILSNRVLGGLRYPSGPVESAPLRIARGTVVLNGAGVAVQSIPGFPADAQCFLSFTFANAVATALIWWDYNSATGDLTITSDAGAADANAHVNWMLVYF